MSTRFCFSKLPILTVAVVVLGFIPAPSLAGAVAKTFKVGRATFTGTPKTICVIQGKWHDGEAFRYQAWSDCPSLRIRPATREELLRSVSLGNSDKIPSTLPQQIEVIEVANRHSRVLVYRDGRNLREILVGD